MYPTFTRRKQRKPQSVRKVVQHEESQGYGSIESEPMETGLEPGEICKTEKEAGYAVSKDANEQEPLSGKLRAIRLFSVVVLSHVAVEKLMSSTSHF